MPGTHDDAHYRADIASAADVQVPGHQRCQIRSSGHRVGCYIRAQLRKDESDCYNEDPEAGASIDLVVIQESSEHIKRIPDGLRAAVDDSAAGGHDNADEARQGEAARDGEELRPERIPGSPREACKVRVVDDEGGEVGDGGHDGFDDGPCERTSTNSCGLVNDRSYAVRAYDSPDEEGDASHGDNVRFDGEQMPNLMHGEPQERQRTRPKQEERHKIRRIRPRRRRHRVVPAVLRVRVPAGPDGADHEVDAVAADPGLHAVPDAGHDAAVEDGPKGAPDAETGAVDDGKGDVVGGANAAGEADEAAGDEVAYPDAW